MKLPSLLGVSAVMLLAGSTSRAPTEQPAAPALRSVALRVHHMRAMRAFYTEAFGARFREVDVQGLRSLFGDLNGTLTLKFVPIRDRVDFSGFPVHQLGFDVDDVKRVVDLARRHGGRVLNPPERVEGRWQAAIRDPDGNTIELSESRAGARGTAQKVARRAELLRLVAAVQDADYRGDLDRLRDLGAALGPYAAEPSLARAALYWRGFAFWRRALNGANDAGADRKTVEQDFADAAREFERAVALDSTYVEARIGAAACLMSRGFLNRNDPSAALPLWRRAQEHLEVVQRDDPDNPRLLFVTAGRVFWSPPTHGGDPRRAITMVEHGLERLSRTAQPADSLEPAWGEAELHMLIAFFHANAPSPDRASAERHARRAIALRPEWYYVRSILLPQIVGRSR